MKEEKNILSHKKNSILDKSNDQNIVINCKKLLKILLL